MQCVEEGHPNYFSDRVWQLLNQVIWLLVTADYGIQSPKSCSAYGPAQLVCCRAEMLHPSCCFATRAKLLCSLNCFSKHRLNVFFFLHKFLVNLAPLASWGDAVVQPKDQCLLCFTLLFFSSITWHCLWSHISAILSSPLSPCSPIPLILPPYAFSSDLYYTCCHPGSLTSPHSSSRTTIHCLPPTSFWNGVDSTYL